MSLRTALLPQNTRRSPAGPRRAALELDAGAMLEPTVYPYPAGIRPVRPFVARVIDPGRGERKAAQLYPPTGNPTQRTMTHVAYAGRAAARYRVAGDVAGARQPAKILRVRPYLFAGGSSATMADKLAAGPAAGPASSSPCEGCG